MKPLSFRPGSSEQAERLYKLSMVLSISQADILRLAIDELYKQHVGEIERLAPQYQAVRDAEAALAQAVAAAEAQGE